MLCLSTPLDSIGDSLFQQVAPAAQLIMNLFFTAYETVLLPRRFGYGLAYADLLISSPTTLLIGFSNILYLLCSICLFLAFGGFGGGEIMLVLMTLFGIYLWLVKLSSVPPFHAYAAILTDISFILNKDWIVQDDRAVPHNHHGASSHYLFQQDCI
ncbi:hypothetical protein RIF29_21331 [Crotalaria pallida]|uniref:Uncharacterized protein n=1 Tax=Crotalaria pallida TaxID=3830 RepID=A0AAN9I8B2_CROPI